MNSEKRQDFREEKRPDLKEVKSILGFEDSSSYNCVAISVASPDIIRSWSSGEVKSPETINYRTFKPEPGGLFCQKIFGPARDYECACGKYKRIKYKGVVCERCGVEVTISRVRRERMGHIELAVPISHIWFLKSLPSRMGLILDMTAKDLEKVIYYESYMIVDPGTTPFRKCQLLSEKDCQQLREEYGDDAFVAKTGAAAVRDVLAQINLQELIDELQEQLRVTHSKQAKKVLTKRLKLVNGFDANEMRPEWMVLEVLPIIPPDLRPLVPLDGGRFATSDLNDLYRRVINRNNRLKSLLSLKTPDVIINNEMRMLQEAVDALFDNDRHGRTVVGAGNRPLKSLSEMLKGKQGRFRQNLLGKRVDYSGRSVIVIGPELKLHQCGLPKRMAWVLFEPFIIRRLKELGFVHTVRSARKMIEKQAPEVWDILEEVTREHPVLLNRAPTLHRLSIQAFEPILIEGDAIRLHPLVCSAFNADFDGDQMAVHVPLSLEAVMEAKMLMLASRNIFSPSSGKPVLTPSQDIVLGAYYLTIESREKKAEGVRLPLISSTEEAWHLEANDIIGKHDRVLYVNPDYNKKTRYGNPNAKVIETTLGRIIFNSIFPDALGFVNSPVAKGRLGDLVLNTYKVSGQDVAVKTLDKLKDLGFKEAMKAGLSIGIGDMIVPENKQKVIAVARKKIADVETQYKRGIITSGERYNKIIDIWTTATDDIANMVFDSLAKNGNLNDVNSVFLMMDSGARGNRQQVRQLCGMRGLMAKPSGEIIERPILSSFREGLSVLEYFSSTHGARKGLADTALKTADAGYLTRKLCDVAMDCVIGEYDDGNRGGIWKSAILEGDDEIVSLSDRIVGRCSSDDVKNPLAPDEVIVAAGELITADVARRIEECGIERVKIMSPLTHMVRSSIPAKAYGINPATNSVVEKGAAVGIIAAQSIGEPGTQLTLRTFHVGGVASQVLKSSEYRARHGGIIKFNGLRTVTTIEGANIVLNKTGSIQILDGEGRELETYAVVPGALLYVADGSTIGKGDLLVMWDPHNMPILSEKRGVINFKDVIPGVTVKRDVDVATGRITMIVTEHKEDLNPMIEILAGRNDSGFQHDKVIATYSIPTGAQVIVENGNEVQAGALLAKTSRSASKTQDITGGLPRIAELFEARRPKNATEMAKLDGIVSFGGILRNKRRVFITDSETGVKQEHLISHGKHIIVHEGDFISKGQSLTDGSPDPHEILGILGPSSLQEYLISEIQRVYRLQGVVINDKHIEIIVACMLKKVRVIEPNDSDFFWGEQVERDAFLAENRRIIDAGGESAVCEPILMGITKSSIETDSFIAAASFQETTKVLTDAATTGKVDYLKGFKENIIMGHLIPAGTGLPEYRNLKLKSLVAENDGEESSDAGIQCTQTVDVA
ncbi:MAG: DNA-directed RNA polymerase subunit beta' [Puniceicoccales bacterium]|jgi:DNA-directed RNA polymerase subunit beta'|nr:DNA-directed RNA polymerase subunit beta' [Puniceicoccales bacterium]